MIANANLSAENPPPRGGSSKVRLLLSLCLLGLAAIALTFAVPIAFRAYGDHGYMAFAIGAGVVAWTATRIAEGAPARQALWIIFAVAIILRSAPLSLDPLLSTDIYRYVWDGKIQAAGINPYRYFPADEALTEFRDDAIYPNINRADTAATIYPPVAQMFFFLVTRFGESVTAMKIAMLACEGIAVAAITILLSLIDRPVSRVVAYVWHPLPIWEIANNGHVDALMMALMMLGLLIAFGGRPLRGGAVIALGALVKPFALLAFPAIWRPWDWRMPAVAGTVMLLCYAPYLSVGSGVFGFLTSGYLNEELLHTGGFIWPLAMWRSVVGALPGDYAAYVILSGTALSLLALAIARHSRTLESRISGINWLLLAFLFLLSPNYPWYFLVVTPFVALIGGAPVWALTVGAVFLQEEAIWGEHLPMMARKSALYLAFMAGCGYAAWKWLRGAKQDKLSRERAAGNTLRQGSGPTALS